MQWNDTIQITWIKCFPLYIYCTEILMGLLLCANNETGSGIYADIYIFFGTVEAVRDCYPFNKNCCVKRLKARNVSICEAEKNIGE